MDAGAGFTSGEIAAFPIQRVLAGAHRLCNEPCEPSPEMYMNLRSSPGEFRSVVYDAERAVGGGRRGADGLRRKSGAEVDLLV